jgi:hypothetical protein
MTAERALPPIPDPETAGYTLDLGRSELRDVMNRYSGRRPVGRGSLLSPPAALVVGDAEPSALKAALEEEGWAVSACGGPSAVGSCPVMRGQPCALRQSVDVAVVYVGGGGSTGPSMSWPLLRCAADGGAPAVVALEGRLDAPRYEGTRAAVGALRGPVAIVGAIREVVERAAG